MADVPKLFETRLAESCAEHFESLRIAAWTFDQLAKPASGRQQIASVLGFSGWQARGSLSVRSTMDFFQETHPSAKTKGNPSPSALVDWASEFTNQLLGRFKNKVLAHGLEFQVSVPVTIVGENMIDSGADRQDTVNQTFRTASHIVHVSLAAQLSPGVELFETPIGKVALPPGKPFEL